MSPYRSSSPFYFTLVTVYSRFGWDTPGLSQQVLMLRIFCQDGPKKNLLRTG